MEIKAMVDEKVEESDVCENCGRVHVDCWTPAPNTRQRAERAAAKIASEINGGDKDDQSRPPELIALLIDPSIDNEVKLAKWLADIIATELER